MLSAEPAFPFDFSAQTVTLLVLGSAPCLYTDLNVAKALRPNHKIMAINDTAKWLPADFVFSFHAEKIQEFADGQRALGHTEFTTHADVRRRDYPGAEHADYLWHGVHFGATSTIGGAHAGLGMGFQEVILCGAPMNGGDGYAQTVGGSHIPGMKRFGLVPGERGMIRNHQEKLREFATIAASKVFSMSGYSRQVLGAPPEVPIYGH